MKSKIVQEQEKFDKKVVSPEEQRKRFFQKQKDNVENGNQRIL